MKAKYIGMALFLLSASMSSCVEDEGNYTLSPINEISISDIEENYYKIAYSETLSISPTVECSQKDVDETQLTYRWVLCEGSSSSNHRHTVISTEKNLDYLLDLAPGTYTIYFQVFDESTGLEWEQYFTVQTVSPFVRGFYLFGDKEDGTCGLDFVSMMDGRDTTVIKDVFVNSPKIKGAQDMIFTGGYNDRSTSLWAISESGSYSLDYSSTIGDIDVREDISADNFVYPTIEVTRPLKVMGVYPKAYGSSNINMSRSYRLLMTENEAFITSLYTDSEAYGNPVNRYSSSTSELFKPAQVLFYRGNSSYISYVAFYDKTHECFTGLNSSYSWASNARRFTTDTEEPFYFDQTKYSPVRTFVYGENGYGNSGRSYALMTNSDGNYYVYSFVISSSNPSKQFAKEIDLSVATDFDKATHYAFFSMQQIILYSVGSQLWAYDYNRKEAIMIQDFGSEITYLAMDFHSNNTPTDFIVATYSASEKGIVRKFTILDDQNKIEVTPHEKEIWNTDLKVVKVEYRNASI